MSTYTAAIADPATQQQRSRMFGMVLGAIAAGQLIAFWLLCSHQVRRAEARQNQTVIQQMALSDCLQYIPGSTIASCSGRDPHAQAARPGGDNPAVTGATPVSFSFR